MDKDKRNLVLVESPNKCATLTKIFKDAGYKHTVVMASYGHFTEIKDGGKYWNTGIYPDEDFKADYAVSSERISPSKPKTYKMLVEELKEQVGFADMVYICSDPDREGEAIAWTLKKFLKIPERKYERVTFHEITPKAVLKAFDNPRKIDENLVSAAQCRQKWDKIFGYRLSPVARKRLNAKSVGRCQSAGLKLVVDREREIQAFVPEKYFDVTLSFKKNGREFKAKYAGTEDHEVKRVPTEDDALRIKSDCEEHFPFVVSGVDTKEKLSYPKPPFTTSTFGQEVSGKLGTSIKSAMSYAQSLFEGLSVNGEHVALITYIRTDSPEFAPEFLPELEGHVKLTYGKDYYSPVRKAKKSENAQDGHEAIRPVDMSMTPEKLASYISDEKLLKVYEIIYRRTEACAMKPSVTSETTYRIKNGEHVFNLVSRELLFDGYKKAYNYKEEGEDRDVTTETFSEGELIDRSNSPELCIEEKSTNPPARFKEATLLKELESSGIGRPSTYSTIVSTLMDSSRGYCTKQNNAITPTELGMSLAKFMDEAFPDLVAPDYTAGMEKSLDRIADGKMDSLEFLRESYSKMEDAVKKLPGFVRAPAEVTDKICPECGKNMVIRTSKYGRFYGCSGYPKCKHAERMEQ